LIVQTTDALKQTVKCAASLAGVISGSILVSYRSIDPQELARSRSSKILSKKGKTPKIEELEAMPRPLELRLQLTKDEALDKKNGLAGGKDEGGRAGEDDRREGRRSAGGKT